MRRLLFAALFVLAFAIAAVAQDATKVDPDHYKVEVKQQARARSAGALWPTRKIGDAPPPRCDRSICNRLPG
jgi:hypothetical protein